MSFEENETKNREESRNWGKEDEVSRKWMKGRVKGLDGECLWLVF
ncbi:hypothetical protein [Bacillus sp. WP8]|nr:hypothetical protein [Bacillus sp. WP8]